MDFPTAVGVAAAIVTISGVGGIAGLFKILSQRKSFYFTHGEIRACYHKHGGSSGRLKKPISKEQDASESHFKTPGKFQRFQGDGDGTEVYDRYNSNLKGVSIYLSKYGAFPVWGGIGKAYEKAGGSSSKLGFPISEELELPRGTRSWLQHFEGGTIFCEMEKDAVIDVLW